MTVQLCGHPRCTDPATALWQPDGVNEQFAVCNQDRCRAWLKGYLAADFPRAEVTQTPIPMPTYIGEV